MKFGLDEKWVGVVAGLSLMSLMVGLSGCNQRRTIGPDPLASESPSPDDETETDTDTFPIQIVTAGNDPGVPNVAATPLMDTSGGNAGDVNTDTGVIVQWFKHIPFPKDAASPEFFFILPKQAFGSEISQVFYRPGVLNSQDDPHTGDLQLGTLAPNGSWAIPLYKSFPSTLGALDTGVIHVKLQLTQGPSREVEIRFNIQPTLPEVTAVLTREPIEVSTSRGVWDREFAQEVYKNPTGRPLVLWFHYTGSSLTLSQKVWVQGSLASFPSVDSYSLASLDRLSLQLPEGGPQVLGEGKWLTYSLNPGETAVIRWVAQPDSQTHSCAVSPQESVIGVSIDGSMGREIVLSEVGVDPRGGVTDGNSKVLLNEVQAPLPNELPRYICQGIF